MSKSVDCFGYPSDAPPPISDTFSDIKRYAPIPLAQRLAYHRARTDAMVYGGEERLALAWGLLRRMNLDLRKETT
jgi:hypothetical protein